MSDVLEIFTEKDEELERRPGGCYISIDSANRILTTRRKELLEALGMKVGYVNEHQMEEDDCFYVSDDKSVLTDSPEVYKGLRIHYITEPLEPEPEECETCTYLDSVRDKGGIPPGWSFCAQCGAKLEAGDE